MRSKITDKYQVTIPKKIRELLKLKRNDSIEWRIEAGRITVEPITNPFMQFKGAVMVGEGDLERDIETARRLHADDLACNG